MIRIIIFVVLALVGGAAGVGAGMFLRPPPAEAEAASDEDGAAKDDGHGDDHAPDDHAEDDHGEDDQGESNGSDTEIAKLTNQFIVPILDGERVAAMVVLSLSLETKSGGQQRAYSREPILRDAFLQVLFDHANAGGFDGVFTGGNRLETLRKHLKAATVGTMGEMVVNVLVTDIARQDM